MGLTFHFLSTRVASMIELEASTVTAQEMPPKIEKQNTGTGTPMSGLAFLLTQKFGNYLVQSGSLTRETDRQIDTDREIER